MPFERHQVNDLFDTAVELNEPERARFLDRECAGNRELRAEVESLLAADADVTRFIDDPIFSIPPEIFPEATTELAGQQFGAYRIIREIGRGGLGTVYLAERADDVYRKEVAIKLIRRGLDTEDILRRFRNERQILAQLEHPHIARLLDGGTTAEGQPFFVMEFVGGEPLLDHCKVHRLSIKRRLELFRKICAAVTYAHQNLVIHRDLKPSNILVTAEGEPKLLDFGIARLLTAEEEDFTLTAPAARVLTPGYASPEQIRGDRITTASDIYSLGVLLYEMLSGQRPYRLKSGTSEEMAHAITHQEAERPSIAAARQSDNQQSTVSNQRFLKGDLDNIVLMALRREPERRYSSAENLAEDIERHQNGLPVTARPNTFVYRAEKFFSRNRAGAVAGALIALALVTGLFATLWQARLAATERDRARLEAEKVKKINAYTQKILNFSNIEWLSSNPDRNRKATIAEALDEAAKNIESDLGSEPEIQAEVLITLGMTYCSQGQYEKAETALNHAIENLNRIHGGENLRARQAQVILGNIFYQTARNAEVEKIDTENIDFFRAKFAKDKSQARWLAFSLNDLGIICYLNLKFAEAERLYREAIDLDPYLIGSDHSALDITRGNLAVTLQARGDFQGAIEVFNRALEGIRAAGNEERAEGGTHYAKMGVAYADIGDYAKADTYFQKSYQTLSKVYGKEHFYTLSVAYQMANSYFKQGKLDEAERLISKSLEIQRRIFPYGHNLTASSERLLGEIFTKRGFLEKGEELLRKSLDHLLRKNKAPNRQLPLAKLSLGENLIAQKRYAEAKPLMNSALEGSLEVFGEGHPFTRHCREVLNELPN